MRGWVTFGVAGLLFYLAGALQQGVAYHFSIFGARPDFLLVAMAGLCLVGNRREAVIWGFVAGLMMGALSGANLTVYVTSRTLAGVLFGGVKMLDLQAGWATTVVSAIGITLVAEVVFLLLAPPVGVGAFLADTIRTAMYNGVLAIPVYALLSRILPAAGR
jgi:rod shape-determining protein MreD